MALDETLLRSARDAGTRWVESQHRAELAKADYQHAIRRLHLTGGSMREVAEVLGISHQRVHQIIEGTGGTRGWKPRQKAGLDVACTFCGLPEAAVAKIVAGPGIYICDRCVALGERVVAEARSLETARTQLEPTPTASGSARCSFCRKRRGEDRSLVSGPGVQICDHCLRLCDEIIGGLSADRPARR